MSCQGLYQPQGWCLCVLSDPQTSAPGAVGDVLWLSAGAGSPSEHWGCHQTVLGCHQAALCARALLHHAPREVLSSPTSTSRLSCCKKPLVSVRVVAVQLHVASGALWVVCTDTDTPQRLSAAPLGVSKLFVAALPHISWPWAAPQHVCGHGPLLE